MTSDSIVIERFKSEALKRGVITLVAANRDEAVRHISSLAGSKNITRVVKSSCPLAGKLGLSRHMENRGINICETSLVHWTLQIKHKKEVPLEEIAALVSTATGEKVIIDPDEILKAAKKALKAIYTGADLGITEADFGIAETGTLVTLENEDNARLAMVLPRLHLTLLEASHVVASLADAAEMIKQTSGKIQGHKLPTLISHFAGRNSFTDAQGKFPTRTEGPAEEYILLIHET